ncbi:MAG: tetratricopeptide repeat protein [Armatimonadota bacterium]|nr:tetratricopeptide repeat protein [Armatimonadota bacterium]
MRVMAIACLLSLAAGVTSELTLQQRIEILWERADRQIDFQKYDDALATGPRAVEIAPESAEAWALLSFARWMHPDVPDSKAGDAALEAVGLDADCALAHYTLGLANWADDQLEDAVELDPRLARAWSMLGLARLDCGDPEGALQALRRAVEVEPDYYESHMNLAEGLSAAGEFDEAIQAALRSVDLSPSPQAEALTRNNVAWTICLARYVDPFLVQTAVDHAQRAVELAPQDPYYWDTLGSVLVLFRDPADAEEALRAAIALEHTSQPTLAYALARQDRDAEARELLSGVSHFLISRDASPHHVHFAAKAWAELGETEVARRAFDFAVRRWPEHPWADEARAWLDAN